MPVLNSSAIWRAEYDDATKVLSLWFKGEDKRYDYPNVPRVIFDELLRAPSAGRYYNEYIKDLYSAA
ncbi:MAG: KTSC domain-containing protein [Hyphomonadaceae bacterium]